MDPSHQKKSMLADQDVKNKRTLKTYMTKPREELKEAYKNVKAKWKKTGKSF